MNQKLNITAIATFSLYSVLMLMAFLVMDGLGREAYVLETKAYVFIGAAAAVVSGVITFLTMVKGGTYDEYQLKRMRKRREIIKVIVEMTVPVICIVGLILDSIGMIVCVGLLTIWLFLAVEAVLALVIR